LCERRGWPGGWLLFFLLEVEPERSKKLQMLKVGSWRLEVGGCVRKIEETSDVGKLDCWRVGMFFYIGETKQL